MGAEKGAERGIAAALAVARDIPGIIGVVVLRGERLGTYGDVELIKVDPQEA